MKRALPLVVAVVAFYLVAIAWIINDRRASQHVFDEFSAANTSDGGLSLAYAYLQRYGRVEMLTRPVSVDSVSGRGVVFRAGDLVPPSVFLEEEDDEETEENSERKEKRRPPASPLLSPDEAEWVERGGRLVLATSGEIGELKFRSDTEGVARKVFPFAPGIERISLPERRGMVSSTLGPRMVALYISGDRVVVVREAIGEGDVIVLTVPELLQNANLGVGNHLPLLVALAGTKRPVYFDEYVHGLTTAEGPLELMKRWGLGPFLLLAFATAMLVLWRGAARIGPPQEEWRDIRSDAVDLVASLGALYQRSMTEAEALSLYHDALTRSVAAQTGLRGDALHQRVADLVGGPAGHRNLQRINDAFRKIEKRRRKEAQ